MDSAEENTLTGKCALVTGAAKRVGAAIAHRLHRAGASIAVHYRDSGSAASELTATLNDNRSNSARSFQADLSRHDELTALVDALTVWAGRLDILINNASSFYATPIGTM